MVLTIQKRRLEPDQNRSVVLAGGILLLIVMSSLFYSYSYSSFDTMYLDKEMTVPHALEKWRDKQSTRKWGLSGRHTQILEQADTFEVFSLYPRQVRDHLAAKLIKDYFPTTDINKIGDFRGYPSVGKVQVDLPGDRETLLASLYMSIAQASVKAKCFYPHHGIRATTEDGLEIELVVCFTCSRIGI